MYKYKELIKNLPVFDQTFKPNKETWMDLLHTHNYSLSDFDFVNGYSREELHKMKMSVNKLICILMWGYPTGGRGNNLNRVLDQIQEIQNILIDYENRDLSRKELTALIIKLESIEKLGRSTWSKLLCFSEIRYPKGALLILDDQIQNAISDKNFCGVQFNDIRNDRSKKSDKKANNYIDYIERMSDLSKKIDVSAEQLEFFLFMFSKILRL